MTKVARSASSRRSLYSGVQWKCCVCALSLITQNVKHCVVKGLDLIKLIILTASSQVSLSRTGIGFVLFCFLIQVRGSGEHSEHQWGVVLLRWFVGRHSHFTQHCFCAMSAHFNTVKRQIILQYYYENCFDFYGP